VFLPNRQKSSQCNAISQYNLCISRFLLFQCSIICINIISMAELTLNNIAFRARQNLYFVQMPCAGIMRLAFDFHDVFLGIVEDFFAFQCSFPIFSRWSSRRALLRNARPFQQRSLFFFSLFLSVCLSLYEH